MMRSAFFDYLTDLEERNTEDTESDSYGSDWVESLAQQFLSAHPELDNTMPANHEACHILAKRGTSPTDESFVIGFQYGIGTSFLPPAENNPEFNSGRVAGQKWASSNPGQAEALRRYPR